jgi:hypothetical protein
MRWPRLTSTLAGLLIALLATGALRLGHLHTAHAPVDAATGATTTGCHTHHACGSCPSHDAPSPDEPASPSDCGECALLAVLLTDGLPVAVDPFFPAPSHAAMPAVDDQVRSIAAPMPVQARGPPAQIATA